MCAAELANREGRAGSSLPLDGVPFGSGSVGSTRHEMSCRERLGDLVKKERLVMLTVCSLGVLRGKDQLRSLGTAL